MANSCDVIIIGAGPAGLATAAALKARGVNVAILEKSNTVGAVWRRHYDRLHLHTDRSRSGLPGLAIPKAYGRYPSRARVVEYLETYAAKFALRPVFNAAVRAARGDGPGWRVEAGENSQTAPVVVVATGLADYPHAPTWRGIETFGGPILHSSFYRNPAAFTGKRVLVVGFGAWAARSPSTSAKRASTWRSQSVARSTSSRGSCSECRSSPGASPADCFPRE